MELARITTPYDTVWSFVKEIAEDSPLTTTGAGGEVNICKFCETYWAESHFSTWKEHHPRWLELQAMTMEERNKAYAQSGYNKPDYWLAVGEHHDPNCLWIRANLMLEGTA